MIFGLTEKPVSGPPMRAGAVMAMCVAPSEGVSAHHGPPGEGELGWF